MGQIAENSKDSAEENITQKTTQTTDAEPLFKTESLESGKRNIFQRIFPFKVKNKKKAYDDVVEVYLQTAFTKSGQKAFDLTDIEGVKARSEYGPIIVKGYLFLIAVQLIIPIGIWAWISRSDPSTFWSGLRDLQDYIIALTAVLTGFSGLAGFVVGRYFDKNSGSS